MCTAVLYLIKVHNDNVLQILRRPPEGYLFDRQFKPLQPIPVSVSFKSTLQILNRQHQAGNIIESLGSVSYAEFIPITGTG